MQVVSCQNLVLGYGHHRIVGPINFELERGSYLSIVGPNGSGKSSFLKVLVGLAKPLEGSLKIHSDSAQTSCAYLPQRARIQDDFPVTVQEVVAMGFAAHHRFWLRLGTEQRHRLHHALTQVGLEDAAKTSFKTLSGGQQQRVLLARALCMNSDMLVLDEPTTGLDPEAAASLYALLHSLHEQKTTIVMVSHDVAPAVEHATHVLVMGATPTYMQAETYRVMMAGGGKTCNGQ
ncbi:ABC transporter ATP-binding protein [Collinsella sp. zg1085]|uniref:metal ABC transporter ATP-binding protein n=1 Tax=Collinsella sp. zg1085 TaxID=2844380 RepID=UPI001C0E54AE|nr:ABC transporter ATP-binding protein [Collinsella sp. zg1085]QWT18167.1 ABC transporter ATP-binding protein [Collinsella sp. zg1085]